MPSALQESKPPIFLAVIPETEWVGQLQGAKDRPDAGLSTPLIIDSIALALYLLPVSDLHWVWPLCQPNHQAFFHRQNRVPPPRSHGQLLGPRPLVPWAIASSMATLPHLTAGLPVCPALWMIAAPGQWEQMSIGFEAYMLQTWSLVLDHEISLC